MFVLFFQSLRYRWFEHVLAAGVVAVVVAAFTAQRSLSSSTQDQVHGLAHKLGKNMLVVPKDTALADFYAMRYGDAVMPDSLPERILESKLKRSISLIQPRLYGNVTPKDVPLVFVGEDTIVRGRYRDAFSTDWVTLGDAAAKRMGVKKEDTFNVNGFELTVRNVVQKPPDGLDVGVFASLGLAQETLEKPEKINAMRLAGCWCRTDIPQLASDVEKLLPETKAMTIAGMMKAQKGTVAVAKRYSAVTLAVSVVLIAGVVMVLVSSQVKRQMRELGLLLATGASPWFLVSLFMTKAALVGVMGGVVGYYLGFPLTGEVASRLIGLPLPVPQGLLGVTVALSVGVSVLSALVPATLAARLDPTQVLREV